jgi:hypothetical protein
MYTHRACAWDSRVAVVVIGRSMAEEQAVGSTRREEIKSGWRGGCPCRRFATHCEHQTACKWQREAVLPSIQAVTACCSRESVANAVCIHARDALRDALLTVLLV